ncbi:hypothetical protein IHV06_00385 [Bifidobacterium dentium]|nr:hypothetical protein [Bifidobacterium dentium]
MIFRLLRNLSDPSPIPYGPNTLSIRRNRRYRLK